MAVQLPYHFCSKTTRRHNFITSSLLFTIGFTLAKDWEQDCDDSDLVLCAVWCGLHASCVFACFQQCAMINHQWPLHYHFYNHIKGKR